MDDRTQRCVRSYTVCVTDYFAGDSRTNRERMLAGDLYIADDPENARRAQRAVRLADAYHRASVADEALAVSILAELVGHLGEGAFVKPPLYVDYGEHISIGARTFINYNLVALDVAAITIGEDCQLGPNVQLLTPPIPLSRSRAATSWRRPGRSPSATTSGSVAAPSCCPASPSATTASSGPDPWSPGTCPRTSWPSATPPA